MRFKNSEIVNQMAGKKIMSIYPQYSSNAEKEYFAKVDEFIILGTRKDNDKLVFLYNMATQKIEERFLYEIREHLNRSGIVHRLYGENYAWAFTDGRAAKSLNGLLASIGAQDEYYKRMQSIKTSQVTFSLKDLEGKGLENLEKSGVKTIAQLSSIGDSQEFNLSLPENYKQILDGKALYDLFILREIATGKNIYEMSGADTVNPELKGKMIFAQDIKIHIKIEEDLHKKGTFVGRSKGIPARYITWKIYFKLPYNNYVSIKRFSKFFNIYKLEKTN